MKQLEAMEAGLLFRTAGVLQQELLQVRKAVGQDPDTPVVLLLM
jgi:hypothetical protein